MPQEPATHQTVDDVTKDWPREPRKRAQELTEKYGPPDELTSRRLIWHDKGPWKRTVLHRDTVHHTFPMPHDDFLEQTINYRVPPDKYNDIMAFDGSLKTFRTAGEAAAICHLEEANFSALNAMHDIVIGEKTVDEARRADAERMVALQMGKRDPEVEHLKFNPPTDAADPDEQVVTDALKEKVKGMFS